MAIVNTKTGERVSNLWLIPILPVFLVGFFFYLVAALTCMAVGTALLDSAPALAAGPVSTDLDVVFIHGMLQLDRSLVGLVGLSSPWLAVVPGFVAAAIWEWATRV
jgi:hypothetical protein